VVTGKSGIFYRDLAGKEERDGHVFMQFYGSAPTPVPVFFFFA
jgi:hypothetical protein